MISLTLNGFRWLESSCSRLAQLSRAPTMNALSGGRVLAGLGGAEGPGCKQCRRALCFLH